MLIREPVIDSKILFNLNLETMKNKLYLTLFLSLFSTALFAQIGGIEQSVADIADTIRSVFPIILGVIF